MDSDSKKLQKARNYNRNAASVGSHISYQTDKRKGKASAASGVMNGLTSTLQGDKNGSFGVNIHSKKKKETEEYLKYVNEMHKKSIDPQSKDYKSPIDSFKTFNKNQADKNRIKKEDKEKYEKQTDAIVAQKALAEGKSKQRILFENPDLLCGSYHSTQYYDYSKRKADVGQSAMAYDEYAPKYINWHVNDYLTGYVSTHNKDGEKLKPKEYVENKTNARNKAYESAVNNSIKNVANGIATAINEKLNEKSEKDESKPKEDISVGGRIYTADASEKLNNYSITSDQIENVIKNGQCTISGNSATYFNNEICITTNAAGKIIDIKKVKQQA